MENGKAGIVTIMNKKPMKKIICLILILGIVSCQERKPKNDHLDTDHLDTESLFKQDSQ